MFAYSRKVHELFNARIGKHVLLPDARPLEDPGRPEGAR